MNTKRKKMLCTILTIIMIIISISNVVFGGVFGDKLRSDSSLSSTTTIQNKMRDVIGIVQIIAVGMSVIMLIALGIKFMVASANDKAEIKKHITVYVVGAVFVFGSVGILEMLKAITDEAWK